MTCSPNPRTPCWARCASSILFPVIFATISAPLTARTIRADEKDQRANIHAQATSITQGDPPFNSPYAGANSLSANGEVQPTFTTTLFMGYRPWRSAGIYVDPEVSAGEGLSDTHGVAGFPNGEAFHVISPNPEIYLARIYVQQVFDFGGGKEILDDGQNRLRSQVDTRRLTVSAGKFSLTDFFDGNEYSHDPRTQFMNWGFMNNGAWDYAADTRGYTWGLYAEYNAPHWALREALVLQPKVANGPDLNTQFWNAYGGNLELEYRARTGRIRLLSYVNRADMGSYTETLANPAFGMDVTRTRTFRYNYGFGLNLERELLTNLGGFFRAGWNPGETETWSFTEIDRTVSAGLSASGAMWGRRGDTLGLAGMINGLSRDHADYLGYGGYGFLIGDGRLNYAPEEIIETYYLFAIGYGLAATADFQFVNHPAYNSDRGPAAIFSGRLHWEI